MNNTIHMRDAVPEKWKQPLRSFISPALKKTLTMKLIIILTMAFSCQVTASAFSQDVSLSVKDQPYLYRHL